MIIAWLFTRNQEKCDINQLTVCRIIINRFFQDKQARQNALKFVMFAMGKCYAFTQTG